MNWADPTGESTAAVGAVIGGMIGGPPGAAIGAAAGVIAGVGVYALWDQLFNESSDDESSGGEQCKLPEGKLGTAKDAQKKVKKGQGPRDIGRIDSPEPSVTDSKWHAHGAGKKKGAINADGSLHNPNKGIPDFSRKTKKWLTGHGWEGLD